jgi:hypothetical protein
MPKYNVALVLTRRPTVQEIADRDRLQDQLR